MKARGFNKKEAEVKNPKNRAETPCKEVHKIEKCREEKTYL